MAERKDRMALLSRFNKLYNEKYGHKTTMNLNVEQWSSDGLIESYGMPKCYDLLTYYFSIAENPTWKFFAYNAEKIINGKAEVEQDMKDRLRGRELAKEWLK